MTEGRAVAEPGVGEPTIVLGLIDRLATSLPNPGECDTVGDRPGGPSQTSARMQFPFVVGLRRSVNLEPARSRVEQEMHGTRLLLIQKKKIPEFDLLQGASHRSGLLAPCGQRHFDVAGGRKDD